MRLETYGLSQKLIYLRVAGGRLEALEDVMDANLGRGMSSRDRYSLAVAGSLTICSLLGLEYTDSVQIFDDLADRKGIGARAPRIDRTLSKEASNIHPVEGFKQIRFGSPEYYAMLLLGKFTTDSIEAYNLL